ncbi:hypothetical protein TNCT_431561 [Trichonephila clavata]|uniref:Uncharacterized protein n=1 Tax=Trichonephila clavata TaxID=2740835 RepID=A0A8X6GPT7_TRICU|nr:hypothetical protein TNCT_431561 [Trichonephila clavata]
MSRMDTDSPPIDECLCEKRREIESRIAANDILISTYLQLISVPDTDQNREMNDVVRKSITETTQAKDALVNEFLPPPM